jgi:hypothetical protein
MAYRGSVIGASVGALVGGISRAAVAAFRLTDVNQDTAWVVLIAGVIGIIVGAPAGAIDKPVFGAVVGAGLSFLVFLANFPMVAFFQILGELTMPSLLEVIGVGALAGGMGGAAAQMAARRQSGPGGRTSGQV